MKRIFILYYLLATLVLSSGFISCKQAQRTDNNSTARQQDHLDFAFHTNLKHAKGFQVINHKDYKEVYVFHPLSGDTMGRYITTLAANKLHDSIKAKGQVIEVPVKSIACLSTTHIASIVGLNLRDKLLGCSSPEYIWDTVLNRRLQNGSLKEIGRGMSVNTEQIVDLMPQVLMQSFMDKTDLDGNLSNLGITLLYNNEWKEPALLGRAEWMKFTALFFCKERMADSIFNTVEQNYCAVKNAAAKASEKPKVMYGYDYKGTWYIPQNQTYVAQIFRDANAAFKSAGEGNASTPKSIEEVYDMYHDAAYWLSTQAQVHTLKDFLSSNERYKDFSPAQHQQVYTNNKRENPKGGNDYWESGVNRPDLLLKDVVKILHPELFPEYETVYWKHLK